MVREIQQIKCTAVAFALRAKAPRYLGCAKNIIDTVRQRAEEGVSLMSDCRTPKGVGILFSGSALPSKAH